MNNPFNYIRNRIAEHSKDDLLEASYLLLDKIKDEAFPIWYIFTLMKWSIIYGGDKYPTKPLTAEKFHKIYNAVNAFNEDHTLGFMQNGQVAKAFQIIHNQQSYLQRNIYNEIFSTQLKIFSISGKYDINNSFKNKTGFSIFDFLFISKILWLYINVGKLKEPLLYFDGNINKDFVNVIVPIVGIEKFTKFIKLLTIHSHNATDAIENFKYKINKEELQTVEMTFFTMFPFQYFKGDIKLIHPAVYKHTLTYYIYEYLKANDENFTTQSGANFEKYVSLGLNEINANFIPESTLCDILPKNSKLVDFVLPDENIYIECKATELQAYPSVNPTDELIYNSLKKSIFKAYFEQLLSVSKYLSPDKENFGIIITYKEFFWSDFTELYSIGRMNYKEEFDNKHIMPENVFFIDIFTWNLIIQIILDKKSTLLNILKLAKQNNSKVETSKLTFYMHIEDFLPMSLSLNYLSEDNDKLEINEKNLNTRIVH